ncbi:MAG TPA: alpha-lytic protease prodomain-containing protein, partial [Pseudoxanthomonas sp.]|nr:alpha-lytic protease prodomain-containing protein [Pseudoxanthomonas sp.]
AQSQLNQTHRQLTPGVMRNDGPRVQSWGVDLRNNRIEVNIDPGAQDAAIDLIARSGIDAKMVHIVTSAQRPRPQHDLRGGDLYLTPNSGCSMGFSAFRGTTTGFVTAGHCAPVNTAVRGPNDSHIGHFAFSTFPVADHAWVQNTQPNLWHILPWVNDYAGGDIDVRGGFEAPVGAAVCRSGDKTGYHCGTVLAKNWTVDYGPQYGVVKNMTKSSACSGFGDSGGAVITPSAEAQGVHSGAHFNEGREDNCGDPAPIGYFQPLQPILNAYDLVLRAVPTCGRLNPRDWRATNGTLTSCDQRFTLAIQGDGNLVLYKQNVGAIWANHVYGSGHTLHMQTDGNLTVRDSANQVRWSTNTAGKRGAVLMVQNDGNVVVYDHLRRPLWNTGTAGR